MKMLLLLARGEFCNTFRGKAAVPQESRRPQSLTPSGPGHLNGLLPPARVPALQCFSGVRAEKLRCARISRGLVASRALGSSLDHRFQKEPSGFAYAP
jgi:hypothetical protein